MRRSVFVTAAILCILLSGCEPGPRSSHGFTLPDGSSENGEKIFTEFACYGCHTIPGVELPAAAGDRELNVVLGGEVTRIKTYGQLVTSIINPSHRLANRYARDKVSVNDRSRMKVYNDVLTVSQLIDLVAFLQSHYRVRKPEPTVYPPY